MSLKYGIGILTYDTTNIGDWAQSAATLYLWWLYFNKPMSFKDFILMSIETSYIDKYPLIWIDRDSISLTNKPDNVDKVILICNAWWLHWKADDNKYLFPPPTWIEPICTSMHFCNKDIFDATTTAYLKKYEPIGSRDLSTKELLEETNIAAYFSGCLTMIFNFSDEKFGFIRQEDYTSKTVNVDCVFKNTKTTISKTAVHKNINDLTNLVVSVQNLYDYSFSEEINTTRLHFWLPLLCNNANVKLFNKNTKQIFVSGDDDNQGQTINRFTGLFEISQDKEKLRDLITQLKDDTLNKINKLLIISDIPADN